MTEYQIIISACLSLLSAIIASGIASLLTYRFAIKRHRSERMWEMKLRSYRKLLKTLSEMRFAAKKLKDYEIISMLNENNSNNNVQNIPKEKLIEINADLEYMKKLIQAYIDYSEYEFIFVSDEVYKEKQNMDNLFNKLFAYKKIQVDKYFFQQIGTELDKSIKSIHSVISNEIRDEIKKM